jgi:hypothetical protein
MLPLNYAFGAFAFYWGIFLAWWLVNSYRHRYSLTLVHKMIAVMLLFKLAYCILLTDLSDSTYWEISFVITFGLYNAATYAVILSIAQGLSITRQYLKRVEWVSLGLHLVFVFLVFCMMLVLPQTAFIVVVVINFSVFKVCRYIKAVNSTLHHRLLEIPRESALVSLVLTKVTVMKKFAIAVCLYFMTQLLIYLGLVLLLPLFLPSSSDYFSYVQCYLQFSEVLAISLICCWFKPKPQTYIIYLPCFNQESFEIPALYQARVEADITDGPIVIVPPGEKDFAVGLPVNLN